MTSFIKLCKQVSRYSAKRRYTNQRPAPAASAAAADNPTDDEEDDTADEQDEDDDDGDNEDGVAAGAMLALQSGHGTAGMFLVSACRSHTSHTACWCRRGWPAGACTC
jgi:hypothetical protein